MKTSTTSHESRTIVRRRGTRQRFSAFTLIELLVVIFIILILAAVLIVAILQVFSGSKKSATESAFNNLKTAISKARSGSKLNGLANAAQLRKIAGDKFVDSIGVRGNSKIPDDPKIQSQILAHLFAIDSLDRTNAGTPGTPEPFMISEENSKSFLRREKEGDFSHVVDGWEQPVRYVIEKQMGGSSEFPPVTLWSAGDDGEFGTEDDIKVKS